ncbi:MAG: TolC family protein [Planctomycetota bacterium]
MRKKFNTRLPLVWALCLLQAWTCGCRSRSVGDFRASSDVDRYHAIATQIEYPSGSQSSTAQDWGSLEPISLTSIDDPEYWNVELEQIIQLALSQSRILRDLGGTILQSPSSVQTYWDPALQDTDPQFGVDAALSAFDAQFSTSIFGEKNDRAINNEFFGGGTRVLKQDAIVLQQQLTKRAVTGTEFTFRHNVDYDKNNAPSNLFASVWNTNIETEVRHPLLQGSGMQFNRIAGPSQTPGLYGGVLIARVNTDIELADFEMSVRDLVSNIENAYWDLYFSYRDLDAKIAARDAALDTWRRIHALYEAGRRGGEAEKEAQAREQFFRFQEEVQNALSGRLIDGTRTGNGSGGGTFRGNGGVHVAERRLRRLIGLPPSDGRLIRPSSEPITAQIHFDWPQVTSETIIRRAELRRQRFETRRRELEWIASKNHLLPRLDTVGRYRWRGFGDDLLNSSGNNPPFDNAYENLTGGDFQEWQLGVELTVPIGYRRAFAAKRHAEMQLHRARAILREQERQTIHDVSDAVAEMQRAYVVSQTSFNRLDAAQNQLAAVTAAFEAEKAPLDLLLDAQRRLADAQSRYFRSLAEHAISVKNVHFSKGTLLDYDGVFLSEGGWPSMAHQDAVRRESLRGRSRPLNYSSFHAPRVSHGAYDQQPDKVIPATFPLPEPATSEPAPAESTPAEPTPAETAAATANATDTKTTETKPVNRGTSVSTGATDNSTSQQSVGWQPAVPSVPITRALPSADTATESPAQIKIDTAIEPTSYSNAELIALPAIEE